MRYRLRISPWLYAVIAALFIVAGVCFGWNAVKLAYRLKDPSAYSVYEYISIALCLIIPVITVAFVTAVIVRSYYSVGNGKLTVRYGFLKDVYTLADMDNIVRDEEKKQLLIVFKDESGVRILIEEKFFPDFSAEIMKAEPRITFSEYFPKNDEKKD